MSTRDTRTPEGFTPTGTIATTGDRRRVVFATVVGTTVEWYDFFIYATAVGLVFGQLFFAPAGEEFGQILAFLTVGISFLFRPLGAFLAGHFGDKYGRKVVLMLTLILMGVATALIGLLPTYEAIGVVGAGPADPPAHPAGHLRRRRVGRRGADGRRACPQDQARPASAPSRRSACRSGCCSPRASWR